MQVRGPPESGLAEETPLQTDTSGLSNSGSGGLCPYRRGGISGLHRNRNICFTCLVHNTSQKSLMVKRQLVAPLFMAL